MALLLGSHSVFANSSTVKRKITRNEKKADRLFIRGEYAKSIELYESAIDAEKYDKKQDKISLHLKIARLSVALMLHEKVATHYTYVFDNNQTSLSIDDICNYVDALRQCGEFTKAELVCRSFAFDESYFRNQRFTNLLNSVTYNRHYSVIPDNGLQIEKLPSATNAAEYWIGEFQGDRFYAISSSYVHDPAKVFYHQNQYMVLNDSLKKQISFPNVPFAMQNGPVIFGKNEDLMIATVNEYNGIDYISNPNSENSIYRTNLFFSFFDKKKRRWSNFVPIVDNDGKYSYAHPFLTDNDSTLYFTSNRPGGYGGMDLYRIERISDSQWSVPVNLGPQVNSEGNEIFPSLLDKKLVFSSNGLTGNGGYDIFHITMYNKKPLDGTLYHYPNPINTAFNDFGYRRLDETEYFVSDRSNSGDDIYRIKRIGTGLQLNQDIHIVDHVNSLTGESVVMTGYDQSVVSESKAVEGNSELYRLYAENQLLLSIYFDFDSDQITSESKNQINDLILSGELGGIESVMVLGYADELGSSQYNMNLSESRAIKVANEVAKYNVIPVIFFEGRGKLLLNLDMLNKESIRLNLGAELNGTSEKYSVDEKKKLLRPARKVDIIVYKLKQNKSILNK
ncbi:MAG: OmpA family protein [Bacteroidales bacterium]